jgi:4-hydroxy-3-methylbut-2-enyl diphosphate reductase
LTHAAFVLERQEVVFVFPALTFFYIYAMHVINRFLDKGASAYNDPERASFHRRHRSLLISLSVFAIAMTLFISFMIGTATFFVLVGLSLLGTAYSLPLLPPTYRKKYKFSKIKDIPGSKTLSEALALLTLVCIVPLLDSGSVRWPVAIVVILVVFHMAYIRSALFDIFQYQGDLIVGAETLPITLGEKKTLILLKILLISCVIILAGGPLLVSVSLFSYLMLLPLLTLSVCLLAYEKRWLRPGIVLEALVEGNFFLAGLLALLWKALT